MRFFGAAENVADVFDSGVVVVEVSPQRGQAVGDSDDVIM